MGALRDFLMGIGLASSAGTTVSSAGTKLLNVRNQISKLVVKPKVKKKTRKRH